MPISGGLSDSEMARPALFARPAKEMSKHAAPRYPGLFL